MAETRSILIIEDNRSDVGLVREALPRAEFSIDWAPTAAEGREILETRRFDLVLLDNGLPDSDALSFIDEIAKLEPRLPVIILSGLESEAFAAAIRQKGAVDFVLKDDMMSGLLPVVIQALDPKPGQVTRPQAV